jgi:hypothetical protein
MEIYASAALVGIFAGAVVGQATGRVVNRTLDLAVAGAGRAYENLVAKDPSDPETRKVFLALEALDVNAKLRMTNAIVSSLEEKFDVKQVGDKDDPVVLCLNEVKEALQMIENTLDEIREEIDRHQARHLHRWRSSNVEEHIRVLSSRLIILDKRMDMLAKCRAIEAQHKG